MTTTFATAFQAETARMKATNGHRPQPRTPILVHLGRLLGRAAGSLPDWSAVRTLLLSLAAFTMLTVAAWGIDWRLGLVVAAVCVLVLEMLIGPNPTRT